MHARALRTCAVAAALYALAVGPADAGLLPDLPTAPDVPVPDLSSTPLPGPQPPIPELPLEPGGGATAGLPALPGGAASPAGGGAGTPDAGALTAPLAVTLGATQTTATAVTVTGLLVPGGAPAAYAFEFGPTDRYGSVTMARSLPAGTIASPVTAQLTGLPPGRPVHFRLVSRSPAGSSAGEDRTAVTAQDAAQSGLVAAGVSGERPGAVQLVSPGATVGRPTAFTLFTRSGSVPVTGFSADFDDGGGRLAALACRQDADGRAPTTGPLAPRAAATFAFAYRFEQPGRHDVRLRLLGGTCASAQRTLRTLRSTVTVATVTATASRARGARAAGAAPAPQCANARLRPTRRNRARIEHAVLCLLNAERVARGLPRLRESGKLRRTALGHVGDMLRRRYLGHARAGGPTLSGRLRRVRYVGSAGETIGLGYGTLSSPQAIVGSWMGSTVHHDIVLRAKYRVVGVGVRTGAPVRLERAATYVANFGTR